MHNPFLLFDKRLLDYHLHAGQQFFVRQTYRRGMDSQDKTQKGTFLISHYAEELMAVTHYGALSHDPQRFLYRVADTTHLQKLHIAASQPEGYRVYAPLLAQKEWKPSADMRLQIKKFIDKQLDWQIKGAQTVKATLTIEFGELFINLKNGKQQATLLLAEIENC